MVNRIWMWKARGNYHIKGPMGIPRTIMMANLNTMAPSPRQVFSDQGVLRITARRNHPKVERKINKIGTWNVRSLFMAGKLDNVVQEMRRIEVNILGISEVRWPGRGKIQHGDTTLYYSGNDLPNHPNGVGVIVCNKINHLVINYIAYSDRVILLQLQTSPVNINVIQCYAPTADKHENEIKTFYKELRQVLSYTRKNENTIILGDFNAKVGRGRVEKIVGEYGLGERNDRGDTLVQFCQEENFIITNTWFKLPARRLYTWQAPGHNDTNIVRNQIDYILVRERFRNGIHGVRTYPGTDVNSDHNPVVCKINIKFKKLKKKLNRRVDITKLRSPDKRSEVEEIVNREMALLDSQEYGVNIEESWNKLKETVKKIEKENIGPNNERSKKVWMTEEILMMMDERRTYKNKNTDMYKTTNKLIQKKVKAAKENWMTQKCSEIEELEQKHDHSAIHKKIKEITGQRRQNGQNKILGTDNKPILDIEQLKAHWTEYVQHLFSAQEPRHFNNNEGSDETPKILVSEVKRALNCSKSGRAPGPDELHIETLKLLREQNLSVLTKLLNEIYSSGNIPYDWLKSTFIPIPKKASANKCDQFRLISLMSHVLKLLLKIIHQRIYKKCEMDLDDAQFGFREGLGTREALFSLSVLLQKCRDQQKDIYMCFIDYEKAFDRIDHTALFRILEEKGLDTNDLHLLKNLYQNQIATVRVADEETTEIPVQRGVRQGCVLSPLLFNIYSGSIFDKALQDVTSGIKINGHLINNLRFADDTAIISDDPAGLQHMLNKLTVEGESLGLKINVEKTKVMTVSKRIIPPPPIAIKGHQIEHVTKFKYLGTWITQDLNPDTEIRARIEQARSVFNRLRPLLCNQTLKLKSRLRFVRCYVYSVLLYGCETWTLKVNTMRRLEAFEMWVYRRLLKIPWTDHITNEEVLRRTRKDRDLIVNIKKRKTAYLGHVIRNNTMKLLKIIIEGKVEGRRGLGRRKHSWLKNIREWTGLDSHSLFRAAQDRKKFAEIVSNLC